MRHLGVSAACLVLVSLVCHCALATKFSISSGSSCYLSGDCVRTNNYPSSYSNYVPGTFNNADCSFTTNVPGTVSTTTFNTEFPFLTYTLSLRRRGTSYSGITGPASVWLDSGSSIGWSAHSGQVRSGLELCLTETTGTEPTNAPTYYETDYDSGLDAEFILLKICLPLLASFTLFSIVVMARRRQVCFRQAEQEEEEEEELTIMVQQQQIVHSTTTTPVPIAQTAAATTANPYSTPPAYTNQAPAAAPSAPMPVSTKSETPACSNCGAVHVPNDQFCGGCGTRKKLAAM